MSELAASMIDLAFAVAGDTVPLDHRHALADAVETRLPWLADCPGAGVHRLNVSAGGGPRALLSNRTRLTLRLPRSRAADACALEGTELVLGDALLHVGAAHERTLRPWGTLYAHLVAADGAEDAADELAFLDAVQSELATLAIVGRAICGRHQAVAGDRLHGYSLMLDGLSAADALRLLEIGLGPHRRLGCGLFVPHKSAAAVGAPP